MIANEVLNYENYIFSNYHIHINSFENVVRFGLILIIILYIHKKKDLFRKKILSNHRNFKEQGVEYIIFLFFILFLSKSLFLVSEKMIRNTTRIFTNPLASFSQKNEFKNKLYPYFYFITQNTPPNSIIMIPPKQNPWLTTGNASYMKYFLYPRKIIGGKLEDNDYSRVNYVLITKGDWHVPNNELYDWPKEIISAKKITIFDMNTKKSSILSENKFDPIASSYFKNAWGLIEVGGK